MSFPSDSKVSGIKYFPCARSYCFKIPIVALEAVSLNCDNLKNLCPSENDQRVCMCVFATGNTLRWRTDRSGVFSAPGVSFFTSDPIGSVFTAMGFTAILTNNTAGQLTSNLIFTPNAVSTTGITVTCGNPTVPVSTTMGLAVTYAGI